MKFTDVFRLFFIRCFLYTCVLSLQSYLSFTDAVSPTKSLVSHWAQNIGAKIKFISDNCSGARKLKENYEKLNMKVTKVNGHDMVQELSTKLENFFSQKVSALRNLATKAVEEENKFVDDDADDLDYHNGKALTDLNLTYDAHFGVPVNFNSSIVHVPTEVYDRGPAVARDIKWTKSLNSVFQNNFNKRPGLSWQYFGTAEGIHRQYPGRSWPHPPKGVPDMYDARRRPWYIQGASSPKDVVLLIDISGSMLGIRIDIAKYASHVLIETLTTNDFFHVVLFNNQSHFICCNSSTRPRLLQATRRNKEFVKGLLPKIDPEDISDWYRGMETTLSLLNETKYRREGSGCQQVIIVLSDGSASYERSVFEKYDPNGTIRVFTYVVGLPQYDIDEMKEMAYRHKGFYLRIPSLGAVWESVSTFIRVLSRPVSLKKVKPEAYTSVFMDATGTGLVSTVSIPVFKLGTSKLLGVMATDVPVKDMSEFISIPLIGHNGYAFAIDNNGLILIHPALDGDKLSKLNPQPNMNVDELEFAASNHSFVLYLRKAMVLNENGTIEFNAFIKTIDELRVRRDIMHYHFIRSRKTAFSIAVASDQSGFMVTSPKIGITKETIEALSSVNFIKKWPYCPKIRLKKDVREALIELFTECKDLYSLRVICKCDLRMINGLFIDALATASIPEFWESRKKEILTYGIKHIYVKTHYGVTRRAGNSSISKHEEKVENETDLTAQSSDEYGRAIRQQGKLTISIPLQNKKHEANVVDEYVAIINPVRLDKQNINVAVTNMEMDYDAFRRLIIKETMYCETTTCDKYAISCDRTKMNQVEGLYCYLLDENAFIVASNEDGDSGLFMGDIDPMLMKRLAQPNTTHSLYDVVILPDHQAACKLYPDDSSDAVRLMSSLLFLPFATWNIIVDLAIMLWWNLWYYKSNIVTASRDDDFLIVTCTTNTTIYLANDEKTNVVFDGNASCGLSDNCVRNFVVSSIPNTNLYFIVVNSDCGKCNEHVSNNIVTVPGKNKEHVLTASNYEMVLEKEKVRRNPKGCHGPSKEDNSHYGNAILTRPSLFLLVTMFILKSSVS